MQFVDPPIEILRSRFEALHVAFHDAGDNKTTSDETFREILESELVLLARDTLRAIDQLRPLAELDRALTELVDLDFEKLKWAVEGLRNSLIDTVDSHVAITEKYSVDVRKNLADLDAGLVKLSAEPSLDPLEAVWALETTLTTRVTHLQQVACVQGKDLAWLADALYEKLKLVQPKQLPGIWAGILEEFDDDRTTSLSSTSPLLPERFFEYGALDDVRRKIADFLASMRPALQVELMRSGSSGYPLGAVPVARVLAWKEDSSARPSTLEMRIARSVSRLGKLYPMFRHVQDIDLESEPLDELTEPSYLRSGPVAKRVSAANLQPPERRRLAFLDLDILIGAAASISLTNTRSEVLLQRYKLGREVYTDDEGLASRREIELQRHLCRFLVEHGVRAYGKAFGRHQIDLVLEEKPMDFVVEVKKYAVEAPPTVRKLKNAVVQLAKYMDGEARAVRGVLAIFNSSDVTITAPTEWLNGRYWILPIDLGSLTPSRRTKLIEAMEGTGGELVRFASVGT